MLVTIRDLRHMYTLGSSKVEVLKGIDLDIEKGDFLAIMGSSGSGKSTLLHILGCLAKPISGTYKLGNTDILKSSKQDLAQIRAAKIGFVFQMFHLLPAMSVEENIYLPFLYNDTNQEEAKLAVYKALNQTGLNERAQHKPNELSGGEMQRVAIARALVVKPQIILADEPTGNLDSKTGKEILKLFQNLHKAGSTIVMVTHDKKVASIAQRILHIQDGKFL